MASVDECTHDYLVLIRETVAWHRAGLVTLDDMYMRLVGLQGDMCEALQLQNHWEAERVAHEKLRRICRVASMPREERRNSLS